MGGLLVSLYCAASQVKSRLDFYLSDPQFHFTSHNAIGWHTDNDISLFVCVFVCVGLSLCRRPLLAPLTMSPWRGTRSPSSAMVSAGRVGGREGVPVHSLRLHGSDVLWCALVCSGVSRVLCPWVYLSLYVCMRICVQVTPWRSTSALCRRRPSRRLLCAQGSPASPGTSLLLPSLPSLTAYRRSAYTSFLLTHLTLPLCSALFCSLRCALSGRHDLFGLQVPGTGSRSKPLWNRSWLPLGCH